MAQHRSTGQFAAATAVGWKSARGQHTCLRQGLLWPFTAIALFFATPASLEEHSAAKPAPIEAPQSRSQIKQSFAGLVEKTAPSVVNIFARKLIRSRAPAGLPAQSPLWRLFRDTLLFGYGKQRIENSLGSGVIIDKSGIVVTNHHVIEAAQGIVVVLHDGRSRPAVVLQSDKRTDLAVLRVIDLAEDLPQLTLADSDRAKVGDLTLAIGNPFGIGQTVTMGIVSGLARTNIGITDFRYFIQTDAAVNPGNSGGALIDTSGKLLGVNTSIYSRSGGSVGVGFAIPANLVRVYVDHALAGRKQVWPWIGLSGERVPARIAMLFGMPKRDGVIVTSTLGGSPADKAGILIGDVILTVDGLAVREIQALRYRVATRPIGSTIKLTGLRMGVPFTVEVKLVAPPATPLREDTWLSPLHPLRGAQVASLSPALAEELGLDSSIAGVVVLQVKAGSAAAKLGFKKLDVLQNIDGNTCNTVSDLKGFKPGLFKKWRVLVTRNRSRIVLGTK